MKLLQLVLALGIHLVSFMTAYNKAARVKIQHGDHFHFGRKSLESHIHHASHEHGPHLETPHEHGPGTGHIHDPKTHLEITHAHGIKSEHTHVNIHLEDYLKNNCSAAGTICVPLSHCAPFCDLVYALKETKVRKIMSQLHCGFHAQAPMACCPRIEVSKFSVCNLTRKDFNIKKIDVDSIIKILVPDQTEPLTCGQVKLDGRIFGGSKAAPGAWPWMALLWYKHGPTGLFFHGCGGTLISRHYVLTAGHCIQPEDADLMVVRLGENDVDQDHDCFDPEAICVCQQGCPYNSEGECLHAGECAPEHQDYEVLHALTHPEFKKNNRPFINDIGLVLLKRGVEVSDYIIPVCLPEIQDPDLTVATVTGWGNVNADVGPHEPAEILQQVEVMLVGKNECENVWQRELTDPHSQICVRETSGNRGVCQGDSGGPLVHQVGLIFVQMAVVGSGSSLCGDIRPSFFCPLEQDFIAWIKQTIMEPLAVRPNFE